MVRHYPTGYCIEQDHPEVLTSPDPMPVALSPRFSVSDAADCAFADSEHSGDTGDRMVWKQRFDRSYVFSCQFRRRVDFAALTTPSVVSDIDCLTDIFLLEHCRQMLRVHTVPVMARVSDLMIGGYRTVVQLVRNTVRVFQRFLAVGADDHRTVSYGVSSEPRPTRGGTAAIIGFPVEASFEVLFWGRHRDVHRYVTTPIQ